jgi:hypothetical protein
MSDEAAGSTADRVFQVRSEEDAFALLERALTDAIPEDWPGLIDFAGWPVIDVRLPHTPISGSISPTMMEAFIDLQTAIYRAHSLLTSGSPDLRGLSKAEKDRLEFRVKVEEGSSGYVAQLAKTMESIGGEVVNRMTSPDLLIAVLGVALLVAGTVAWKAWLSQRTELRKAELEKDEKRAWLDTQKEQLAHDTERYRLLVSAINKQPMLADVEAAVESARDQLIRAVGDERGGTVQGVVLAPDFVSEIASRKRQYGTPTTFSGAYRVSRVDTTAPDGFRVTLTDVESGEEISASLQDVLMSEEYRRAISEAEWSKVPLRVTIQARRLRNKVVDAVVISAEPMQARQRA